MASCCREFISWSCRDEAIRPRMDIGFPFIVPVYIKKIYIIISASDKYVRVIIVKLHCSHLPAREFFPDFPTVNRVKQISIAFCITHCNKLAVMRESYFLERDIIQKFFPDEFPITFEHKDLFKCFSRIAELA